MPGMAQETSIPFNNQFTNKLKAYCINFLFSSKLDSMRCARLGFESIAPGWKVQTYQLSCVGTHNLSKHKEREK